MISALFTAAALLFQAAPAAAASPPAAAVPPSATTGSTVSPATVTGKKKDDLTAKNAEVVCRTEPVLGTLFPKKICARRDEMAERTRVDQKETREATNLRPYKIDP